MESIKELLEEWIRGLLIEIINGNLVDMFDGINTQVSNIAEQVGQTPMGWNENIFSMMQTLSETVIVPIAGIILTFVLCYELITMITEKNNMHEVDTFMFFKYFFKMWVAVFLVTHVFDIVMAFFDLGQYVVSQSAGLINTETSVDITAVLEDMAETMADMSLGGLVLLVVETMLVKICMWALVVIITVIVYGRMIEIYRASGSAGCNQQTVRGHFGILALASQ